MRRQIGKSRKEYWNRFLEKTIKDNVWRALTYTRVAMNNTILILKEKDGISWPEIK